MFDLDIMKTAEKLIGSRFKTAGAVDGAYFKVSPNSKILYASKDSVSEEAMVYLNKHTELFEYTCINGYLLVKRVFK